MAIAPRRKKPVFGPPDEGLRRARVCYDHLAGEVAVAFLERLRTRRLMRVTGERLDPTPAGKEWFAALGIDFDALRATRRPLCRPCLDWSERRFHLAGSLGAAFLARLLALRLARHEPGSRALSLTPRGQALLGLRGL
jgi:hypothetical protein